MSAAYTVTEPLALGFGNPNVTDVSCFGYTNGSAQVTVFGGVLNYIFTWNGTIGSNPQNGLTAGVYTVVVTDGNNCTASTTVTVSQPGQFSVSLETGNASCFGANNGSIVAIPSGGTP